VPVPDCTGTDAAAHIARLAETAADAISADDAASFSAAWESARAVVPCLEEPLPTGPWARLLYGASVVAWAQGRPWEVEVDAALRTDPAVARTYGPPETRSRALPSALAEGDPVAPGARFWVDGHPVVNETVLDGLHVVQRADDGTWDNRIVRADVWPSDWAQAEAPRRGPGLLVAGLATGVAGAALGAGSYAAAHAHPRRGDGVHGRQHGGVEHRGGGRRVRGGVGRAPLIGVGGPPDRRAPLRLGRARRSARALSGV
jgi:hypothetical protein